MGVTVQVRDLDEQVQLILRDTAAREGISLSAYLRRELTQMAHGLEMEARANALENPENVNRFGIPIGFSGLTPDELVAVIREGRGE